MTKLPRDLRFYTFAIPISALAGWGYADSFNTYTKFFNTFGSTIMGRQSAVHYQSIEPVRADDLLTRLMKRKAHTAASAQALDPTALPTSNDR